MYIKFEPRRKKTDFQGLQPGSTRTGLYRDRRSPPKNSIYQVRDCSYYICIKQIKISCAVRITSPCDLYPLTPHLYIYSGIHYFLPFFCSKQRLWVLVRTASRVPTIYVLSKYKKKYHNFSSENYLFHNRENLLYITWACFRNAADFAYAKTGFLMTRVTHTGSQIIVMQWPTDIDIGITT